MLRVDSAFGSALRARQSADYQVSGSDERKKKEPYLSSLETERILNGSIGTMGVVV